MQDHFAIPDNVLQNNKAQIQLMLKEDTLMPGTSILNSQLIIKASQEWKVKEIVFTLNRREYNDFIYLTRTRYHHRTRVHINEAGYHQNYEIWKNTRPGKSIINSDSFEFQYPIPIDNSTPASFFHDSTIKKFKTLIDYFIMAHVVSGDNERSLLMTLPIKMLSATIPKPGLSNLNKYELPDCCGCSSNGFVEQRLSIADPNISPSKVNLTAEYIIDNSKSEGNIASVIFSIMEMFYVVGIKNFEGYREGGEVACFDERAIVSKTIPGVQKGEKMNGIIDLELPADPSLFAEFGNSFGINVRRTYELMMFPVFSPTVAVYTKLTCLLNAAQSIQGNQQNIVLTNIQNPNPIYQQPSNISQNYNTPNQIQDPQQILVMPNTNRDNTQGKINFS